MKTGRQMQIVKYLFHLAKLYRIGISIYFAEKQQMISIFFTTTIFQVNEPQKIDT